MCTRLSVPYRASASASITLIFMFYIISRRASFYFILVDPFYFFKHFGIFFLAFNFDNMFKISILGESDFSLDLIFQGNIKQKEIF